MRRFAVISLICLTLFTQVAHARHRDRDRYDDRDEEPGYLIDPRDFDRDPGMSADEAAGRAQSMYGGRVLSVSPESDGDRRFYRVKLLSDGRVRVVRIDSDR